MLNLCFLLWFDNSCWDGWEMCIHGKKCLWHKPDLVLNSLPLGTSHTSPSLPSHPPPQRPIKILHPGRISIPPFPSEANAQGSLTWAVWFKPTFFNRFLKQMYNIPWFPKSPVTRCKLLSSGCVHYVPSSYNNQSQNKPGQIPKVVLCSSASWSSCTLPYGASCTIAMPAHHSHMYLLWSPSSWLPPDKSQTVTVDP